ncbi:carbamoyltransferase [Streptomyces mashuensis]|uniref:Carbamoyltransferase n=1 Tax=Streptomyces mashuensis TaxID=33904 RepID=A0A919BAH6_9ACTN|nr:carbamoyltransferase HypF [Streptomyces mashuensis]GHF71753.1 carbamoyltransferase [Streptomyces mashuensis]
MDALASRTTPAPPGVPPAAVRRRLTVTGVVQGVGFRPFVHRLATELALSGHVGNTPDGVLVEVEGHPDAVAAFCSRLPRERPPLAAVTGLHATDVPPAGTEGFTIRPSHEHDHDQDHDHGGTGRAQLPPDTAPCDACLRELADPADRRHRHPFITCTHCGPRFTIVRSLPYDRPATTMAAFPLCRACAREYADPADRRFHAQPLACPDCGPRLTLTPAPGHGSSPLHGDDALTAARRMLAAGRILAVKGIGGYHLACDASDPAAVAALRTRKARGDKPFAVMCAGLDEAARVAVVTPAAREALTGPGRPVVLLRPRADAPAPRPAPGVSPGSPYLGVMLPYAPVHHLLFGLPGDPPGPRLLVMTSGNRSGEPVLTDDRDALTRLAGIADAWLSHDRPIEAPCDDSVLRVRPDGTLQVLRRSRGHVPRPLPVPVPLLPALAAGGDLKNTLCLGEGHQAWFSQHIGDMGDLATQEAHRRAEQHLRRLTGVRPRIIAADRHPGYHSTRAARHRAAAGLPLRLVQHHHAHIASAMAEHGLDGSRPVIGVAFDGTGYGDDATIWGGEVLLADYDGHRRFAHLAPAPLPGGDAGVANPCRVALARLRAAGVPWESRLPSVAACTSGELALLGRQLERGTACVPTSSVGRLFDAVSSLLGLCHRAGHEAQAAVALEAVATTAWDATPDSGSRTAFGIGSAPSGRRPATAHGPPAPLLFDPSPVLRALTAGLRRGVPPAVLAAGFHRSLAAAVAELCRRARRETGIGTVALTGGVFANALLEDACTALLAADGFEVLRHGEVPPGDGGLALGQLLVAARERPAAGP